MNSATYNKTVDVLTILKDAGAVTSSGTGQVGGSAKIIDLAGDPTGTTTTPTAGMGSAPDIGMVETLIDVTACDAADTNETYVLYIEVSNSSSFASGNLVVAQIPIIRGTTGRFLLPFSNWQAGTYYRYVRIGHTLGGTTPSINYVARIGKQ